jgi:hypothetical protein
MSVGSVADADSALFLGPFIMSLVIACSSCGAKLRAPDNASGRTLKCPKCCKPVAVTSAARRSTIDAPEGSSGIGARYRIVAWSIIEILSLVFSIPVGVAAYLGIKSNKRTEDARTAVISPKDQPTLQPITQAQPPKEAVSEAQSRQALAQANREPAPKPDPESLQKLLVGPEIDKPVPIDYLRVTAEQVSLDIQLSDPAINKKYDRPVQLEGVVKEIGIDERGKFILFYTTLPVPFYLISDEAKQQAEKLKPGDKAALRSRKGISPLD